MRSNMHLFSPSQRQEMIEWLARPQNSALPPTAAALALSRYSLPPLSSSSLLQPSQQLASSLTMVRRSSTLEIERALLMRRIRELDQDLLRSSSRQMSFPTTTPPSITTRRETSVSSLLNSSTTRRLLGNVAAKSRELYETPLVSRKAPPLRRQSSISSQDSSGDDTSTPGVGWDVMFKALVAFRVRHGHTMVKEKDDPKLSRWVRNQRNRRKQGAMSRARVDRLDSIGFVWEVLKQESWDVMYSRLVEYKKKHGDCLVPRTYKSDPKLGRWVDTQRNTEDMRPDRLKKLNDLGFVWRVHQKYWDDMLSRLIKYKEKYGDCAVPIIFKEDPKLGTWVHVQRSRRKLLSEERRASLNEVGFVWCMYERTDIKDDFLEESHHE